MTELTFFRPKSVAGVTTMSMIARPVSSLHTKLRIRCVGLGPFPVLRGLQLHGITSHFLVELFQ